MTDKEKKLKLQEGNIIFTISWFKDYYGELKELRTSPTNEHEKISGAIWENNGLFFGNGMNVTKWGPTCITLYTFDLFKTKTVAKIKYSDITILDKIINKNK